jgi:hypothetical protein
MILDLLSIALAAFALYQLQDLKRQTNARLTTLERRDPQPEKRVTAQEKQQPKQIFEKPIVKNAKEVKPLEIGDGRMRFDAEAQVAEWV